MAYMVIEDFSLGMDLRRSVVTASIKSCRLIRNGFVNSGGEIEKRKAIWQDTSIDLSGTYGLAGYAGQSWVFGPGARPASLHPGIGYQQLVGAEFGRFSDVDVFNSQFYVVVEKASGGYQHFYNGALVPEAPQSPTAMAHRSKMYALAGNVVYFSAIDNATLWTPGASAIGAGFIQLDGQDEGQMQTIGMAAYYDQMAIFGRASTQLWAMDEDPAQNQLIQSLSATGLVAYQALARYSNGDVLFLHDSGVRSLKARDASNAASVTDIGSPMDDELRALVRAAIIADGAHVVPNSLVPARGIVEPTTGQFWLVINDKIYVLSLAPSSNIVAWSRWDVGFNLDYVAVANQAIVFRSGNNYYVYGANIWDVYDGSQLEVVLPMAAANEPATYKQFTGMDAAIEGTWTFEVGTDVQNPNTRDLVGTATGATFNMQNIGLANTGTHIGLRATCTDASRARLGNLIVHFNKGETG